ncbi:hypothetical protein HBB16_08535 [Pseudonocardia sp. MCCB 268]|nr:hypothetical protein [Pseudonocardia cytotoxica]
MALQGGTLLVPPGAARERLARRGYYPKMRRLALVQSSDGAFVPADDLGPTLVLHAEFGDRRRDAGLGWACRVAREPVRAPLAPPGDDDAFRIDRRGTCAAGPARRRWNGSGLTRATGRAGRQHLRPA